MHRLRVGGGRCLLGQGLVVEVIRFRGGVEGFGIGAHVSVAGVGFGARFIWFEVWSARFGGWGVHRPRASVAGVRCV